MISLSQKVNYDGCPKINHRTLYTCKSAATEANWILVFTTKLTCQTFPDTNGEL